MHSGKVVPGRYKEAGHDEMTWRGQFSGGLCSPASSPGASTYSCFGCETAIYNWQNKRQFLCQFWGKSILDNRNLNQSIPVYTQEEPTVNLCTNCNFFWPLACLYTVISSSPIVLLVLWFLKESRGVGLWCRWCLLRVPLGVCSLIGEKMR